MNWPDDADGDVLRRLAVQGFDFAKSHVLDFNIDFANWPPPLDALSSLARTYPDAQLCEPSDKIPGYVLVRVTAILSYDVVIRIQAEISAAMAPFGGQCDSWGILSE
jgi:hypothetical protein